jgi:large subunit ribosomal protein L21e
MARRSKGLRGHGRGKFTKHPRERGQTPVSRSIQDISVGSKVVIHIDPGVIGGQPHHRYHGRVGVIEMKMGRAYVVEFRDGGKIKKVISGPEHLRLVR